MSSPVHHPRLERLLTDPVAISPEQLQDARDFLEGVLEEHGHPTQVPIAGRFTVGMWDGREADLASGNERVTLTTTDVWPKIVVNSFKRNNRIKRDWEKVDSVTFDPGRHGREASLTYAGVTAQALVQEGMSPNEARITAMNDLFDLIPKLAEKSKRSRSIPKASEADHGSPSTPEVTDAGQQPASRLRSLGQRALSGANRFVDKIFKP